LYIGSSLIVIIELIENPVHTNLSELIMCMYTFHPILSFPADENIQSFCLYIRKIRLFIITECRKYERERQNFKIDLILDKALGPKTEDNTKMLPFLKILNFYNTILKKNIHMHML
jgi:hypothetical protein